MNGKSAVGFISSSEISANIVRPFRKKPAISASDAVQWVLFNPDSVNLNKAAGGFNCVIEFNSQYCLRRISDGHLFPGNIISVSAQDLQVLRSSLGHPFNNPVLNTMPIDPTSAYAIAVSFVPISLQFSDPHKLCVTYTGDLTLLRLAVWQPPPPPPIGPTGGTQAPSGPERAIGSASKPSTVVPALSSLGSTASPVLLDPNTLAHLPTRSQRNLYWAPVCDIGTFPLVLCCDFDYDANPDLTQVLIYAVLSSATVNVQVPQGDVSDFYNKFVKPRESSLTSPSGPAHFPLAPTISLVGKDPANVTVPEIQNFDVSVFYINSTPAGSQALVAAFNLVPGCNGIIEDVQDFVGNADYGVISDEFLIERIFLHKWALGRFYRTFPAQNSVQVKKNGQLEDATIFGTLHLDSLDWVSIECEANTGTDYVRIGGSSTATATSIQLQDGTVLGPNDVDLGPPNQNPWSVYTNFDINPSLSSDPNMRAFQIQAHDEAYQYCARPFSSFEPSDVLYARTEGVLKRVFFLGTLPEID